MAYAITREDDSTDLCRKMAIEDDRNTSDFIRHLVKKENRRRKRESVNNDKN